MKAPKVTLQVSHSPTAEKLTGPFHCAGVDLTEDDLTEALSPHLAAIETVLKEMQAAVDARLEELMLHIVKEDANAAVVSRLLGALGERSVEDTAFAERGLWLRVAIDILDRGATGTMLQTCLPVITDWLPQMIKNLPVQLLASNSQVRHSRIPRALIDED